MDETLSKADPPPRPAEQLAPVSGPQCACAPPQTAPGAVVAAYAPSPTSIAGPGSPPLPEFVYAIGNVEARVPTLSVEKEFAHVTRGANSVGLNDQQTFRTVLSDPENRYLVRHLCWVFTVQGIDTYILRPRHPGDYDLLVEATRYDPSPLDLDVVIGLQGPLATPDMCNGLIVPIVAFDQIYSFDRVSFAEAVPRSEDLTDQQNEAAVHQVLEMILRIADNAGATPEHRALNYLAMRYADIYARTGEQFGAGFALSGIEVRPSALAGDRTVVNCIFTYTNRQTTFAEKFMVPVDVTEQFPFLVGALGPHYDRM
jgi:PatG C-terminal